MPQKMQTVCSELAHFLGENCAILVPRARFFTNFQQKNPASTRARVAATSYVFQRASLESARAFVARCASKSQKIWNKFGRRRRNFLCEFDAGRARFRQRTPHRLDATFLRRQKIFEATPAEGLVRCASTNGKFPDELAHFLAKKLRNLRAERALFWRSTPYRVALELRRGVAI